MLLRTRLLPALAAALATLPAHAGHITYCCNDENGRQVCSDILPRPCWDRAYREIDERGMILRRVDAPLTPEQRAQRDAEQRRKKEQERLAKEERLRNQALLDAYGSVQDIEAVRDRTVREIEKSLQPANESYAAAAKRQKELSDEMQFYRNKPAPKELLDAMKENESELRAHASVIESKQKEIDAVRAKYDDERRRYIELTRRAAPPPAQK